MNDKIDFTINDLLTKITVEQLKKYTQEHPGATIDEFINFVHSTLENARLQEKDRREKEKQWYKDNLVGKNIMVKKEAYYYIFKFSWDKTYDTPIITDLCSFTAFKNMCGETEYRVAKSVKPYFNKDWIKTPYSTSKQQYSVYIIPDEKLEEITNKFKEYIKFFKELTKLRDSDYVVEVK